MNVKQFLCAGMTGALLVAGLTACAPGAPEVDPSDVAYQTAGVTRDTVLFTVDGTEVTADEYLFWLLQSVASAKQSGYLADDDAWEEELNGVPTAEYLKEDARNTSVLYTTVSNHAAAAGLTVTEEEQAEADAELETLTQRVDSYYGMTLQEYLDQQCISEAAFRKLNPPRPWPWVRSASPWKPPTATTSFCARTLPTRSASSSGTAWRPSTPITP